MADWIDTLAERLEALDAPALSLYLDVNPAHAENLKDGHRIRAENAMKAAGAPRALIEEVVARLKADPPHKRGRTLVLFAAEDPGLLFETAFLRVDLPIASEMDRVIARWGAPYVAPLLLVRDDYARYAVVYMDRERWRYFDVHLGEIQEKEDAFLAIDTSAWRKMTEPTRGSPATPTIGTGHDLYESRIDAWVHRFYKDAASLLDKAMIASGAERLILCGPEERRAAFEGVLSNATREKIAARLSGLPHPGAAAAQVLAHVEAAIEEAERTSEVELLGRIREKGIWGLVEVLQALQEGRLYTVAVPWTARVLLEKVYRCSDTGFVAATEEAVRAASAPGATVSETRLDEVLPELAVRHGSRLEFVRGEAERLLTGEMGGLAGLLRY